MARQRHKTAENVEKLRQVDDLARVARARFVVKRVNGQVEAEFGGRFMHVRSTIKMKYADLMFDNRVLAADQIFRLEAFKPAPAYRRRQRFPFRRKNRL